MDYLEFIQYLLIPLSMMAFGLAYLHYLKFKKIKYSGKITKIIKAKESSKAYLALGFISIVAFFIITSQ